LITELLSNGIRIGNRIIEMTLEAGQELWPKPFFEKIYIIFSESATDHWFLDSILRRNPLLAYLSSNHLKLLFNFLL
jgi:hypothetical protein